jgi:pantothenate kinase
VLTGTWDDTKVMQDPQKLIQELSAKASSLPSGGRYMLGLVGYPGAGKSTTANYLVEGINLAQNGDGEIAVVLPMDGFHRYNAQLKEMNLFHLKGVPDSFDGQSFVSLLRRVRQERTQTIGCPCFDRALEEPTEDAIKIKPSHKLVVVEGNYLLLDRPPWDKVRENLDEVWFVDCDKVEMKNRLKIRHALGGRDPEAARIKMESTDLPNAELIETTRKWADRVISLPKLDT